jgi:hypothetical protein
MRIQQVGGALHEFVHALVADELAFDSSGHYQPTGLFVILHRGDYGSTPGSSVPSDNSSGIVHPPDLNGRRFDFEIFHSHSPGNRSPA